MKKLAPFILAASLLAPSGAWAAGFNLTWETPGCPSACVYVPAYVVHARSADFDLEYEAVSGGAANTFTEQFTLPTTPTSDVTFTIQSVTSAGRSAESEGITLPASAWSSPVNPYVPTINSVTAIP